MVGHASGIHKPHCTKFCSSLSCPSPSCQAGLLPPSMQGKRTVSKQVQKGRSHQQRRRRRERSCRLTQSTCPLALCRSTVCMHLNPSSTLLYCIYHCMMCYVYKYQLLQMCVELAGNVVHHITRCQFGGIYGECVIWLISGMLLVGQLSNLPIIPDH